MGSKIMARSIHILAGLARFELAITAFEAQRLIQFGHKPMLGTLGRIRTHTDDGRNIVPIQLGDKGIYWWIVAGFEPA